MAGIHGTRCCFSCFLARRVAKLLLTGTLAPTEERGGRVARLRGIEGMKATERRDAGIRGMLVFSSLFVVVSRAAWLNYSLQTSPR